MRLQHIIRMHRLKRELARAARQNTTDSDIPEGMMPWSEDCRDYEKSEKERILEYLNSKGSAKISQKANEIFKPEGRIVIISFKFLIITEVNPFQTQSPG